MSSATRRSGFARATVLILTIAAVSFVLVTGRAQPAAPLPPAIGQPAPQTFTADEPISIVDETATAQARQLARNNVDTEFQLDAEVTRAVGRDISLFFTRAREVSAPVPEVVEPSVEVPAEEVPAEEVPTTEVPAEAVPGEEVPATEVPAETTTTTIPEPLAFPPPLEEQLDALRSQYPLYDSATIATVLGVINDDFLAELEVSHLDEIETQAGELAIELLSGDGILAEKLNEVKSDLVNAPRRLILLGLEADTVAAVEIAVAEIVAENLQDNRSVDASATELARQNAEDAVIEVVEPYLAGQTIVEEGDLVSAVQWQAIVELDLLVPTEEVRLDALAASGALIVLLSVFFLWRIARDQWERPKLVALFGLLLVLAAAAARLPEIVAGDRPELGYLIPAAALGFLAAILFNPRTALLVSIPMTAFTALATGDLALTVFAGAATMAPVPLVSAASSRTSLRLAVVAIGAVLAPLGGALAWFFDGSDVAWRVAGAAGSGGVIAGVVALGALPFFENLFKITTTLTLLDLTDRNHPALRRIEEQAPGSFNHSILVGTLAGRASRAVGANALLAQAAAYYHDLGKTTRPLFFIENQFGVSNPHDELTPEQSADIIRSHVTDGLKLAKQYRLPDEVADGIRMHHGTGIMRFFYHKALALDPGSEPDDYRHTGTKPKRKEMAILMLADATEGAVRSLVQHEDPNIDNISKAVDQVIAEKQDDGQLDESSLTFGELTKVRNALVDSLIGYYHSRIPYPGFPG
ncbi:MAG: HDIG domain-containing metalloprotein [Acidimicrobiia bacterium]